MSDLTIASNGVSGAGDNRMNMVSGYLDKISAFDRRTAGYGSPLGIMGVMMNPRHINAITGQAKANFHRYDTNNILREDMQTLKPMAESLHEYRFMGKRIIEKDRVTRLLDIENDKAGDHKVAALYKLYCAIYGGLKNDKAINPYSIKSLSDLKDPGLLIRQSKHLIAPTASMARSKDIEKLTEVAVEGGSPELAAVLLDEMSKGLGVDDKTVKAIFVDAMEKMGEAGHKRFLTAVDASYQKLTGKTLDEYIARQYSGNVGKGMLVGTMGGAALGALGGAVTGAIAGLHCALPGVIIGGIAGFIAGWTTSETGRFGANEKGCEYLDILDKARQTTHHISNPATVLRMMRKPVGLIGF